MLVFALLMLAGTPAAEFATPATPTALERFAGDELGRYLAALFDPPRTGRFVLRRIKHQGGAQTIRLRTEGKTLYIEAGSPQALLWAVYELVERFGVRYLLHGDVFPPKRSFQMPDLDLTLVPRLPIRQWRVMNEHAVSQISWGLADYKPFIDQLAKLKFNRLLLYIWQTQPFLDYQVRGIRTHSGTLFFGFHYPITPDMIGKRLFGDVQEFWNPDLPLQSGYAAAHRHLQGLIDYGRSRGMEIVVPVTLTEYPPEFAPALEHPRFYEYHRVKVVVPGAGTRIDDPALTELASAVLRATVLDYRGVDQISLDMAEFREWVDQYEEAWKALDAKYHIEQMRPLHVVLEDAAHRTGFPGGAERAVREVKGDIVALRFYDHLLREVRPLRAGVKLQFASIAEELFPVLPHLLPPDSETLNFIDYTPSRVLKRRDVIRRLPIGRQPALLVYTLHDDNVGLLPQLATGSLHELTGDLVASGWSGFSTRLWLLGDHDGCAAYLSQAAWRKDVTPESVYRDQLLAVCGEGCVEDMLTAFRELEATTVNLEWHGLGLTFFTPQMMMKHWQAVPMPPELAADRAGYQRARLAVDRTRRRAARGKEYLDYWSNRLAFGAGYLATVDAVRNAAIEHSRGNRARALQHLRRAIQIEQEAISRYAAVV